MASKVDTDLIATGRRRNLRQRRKSSNEELLPKERYDQDWDKSLPYGGKVYLARRKKADPWWIILLEVIAVVACFALLYYAYYYNEHLHFHISRGYAHLGFSDAQHVVGQRLLHGRGVEQNEHAAMEWFKKAADQGHPHASYNLAVGHLKGIRTDILQEGESHRLIEHAASNGVEDARQVLHEVCARGKCT